MDNLFSSWLPAFLIKVGPDPVHARYQLHSKDPIEACKGPEDREICGSGLQ